MRAILESVKIFLKIKKLKAGMKLVFNNVLAKKQVLKLAFLLFRINHNIFNIVGRNG